MNLEELTFKQVCNCLGLIKKLVVENIINFDIDTGIATLNYDNATKYLENQNLEQKQEIERLNKKIEEIQKINLADHKYASEMEDKYITTNNIINELDTFLKNKIEIFDKDVKDTILHEQMTIRAIYDYLQIVKGDNSNE